MLGSMLDSESLTQQAVRRQLAAMPSKFYLIRLIHSVERKPAPAKCLWTRVELVRDEVVRSLRADNRLGFNVYLWPYAERRNAGYIFLDLDHARPDILQDMRIHGHEPCVVLETSPGHLQAWVHVSTKPLEPAVATTLGRFLAERYRGDRASTDWRHLGRLAGFRNFKPAICGLTGLPPTVQILYAEPVLATAAQQLLDVAQERLLDPTSALHPKARRPCISAGFSAGIFASASLSPTGASSISGWPANCSLNTPPRLRLWKSCAWAARGFLATMAIPKTTCAAPWREPPHHPLPALCAAQAPVTFGSLPAAPSSFTIARFF